MGAAQRGRQRDDPAVHRAGEKISRQDLDPFFKEWLFTPAKPASLGDLFAAARAEKTELLLKKKAMLKR